MSELAFCSWAPAQAFESHAARTTATPSDGSVLPFPPVPSASKAAPRLQDSVHKRRAQPEHLKPGAPNVLIILLDDVGFGQASTFGGEVNTPTLSRLANEGISYNTFHTTSICSPTRAALVDRPQSPACRQRHDRRARGRLGRLHRRDPEDVGDDGRSAAGLRLQHGGDRQVAQHAGRPDHGDGSVRPLADRARLRLLLRLHRRRDVAMGTAAGREHQPDRAAARREVPPERGPGAARRRLAAAPPGVFAGQAILPVLGAGRRARSASDLQGMGRQVQGQVRRRLGCLSRACVRAPEADGMDSGRHQAHAARRQHAVVGQHSRGAAPVPAAADGDLRRLRRARGRAGRQADRRARPPRHPRQHDRHLHLRRQRRQRRRPERHDQRIAGAERHPEHGRAAARGAGQDGRPRRAGRPQDRQHVPRRMGVGRQHAVPIHEADRLALRRHAQPDGHLLAEGHQARSHAAGTVPPRQRHRADHLRDRRHQAAEGGRRLRAGSDRRREPRLHVCRREGADAQARAVLRQQRQPRDLPGRLDRGDIRPAGAVAAGCARPRRMGFGQGPLGALQHHQGLLARPTIWPPRTRSVWRNCRRRSMHRPGPTRSIRWARASGCACTPRIASRRRTRAGSSTRPPRGCPNSRRRGSAMRTTP